MINPIVRNNCSRIIGLYFSGINVTRYSDFNFIKVENEKCVKFALQNTKSYIVLTIN